MTVMSQQTSTNTLWNRVLDLPLHVEAYSLEGLELVTNTGFHRMTTEVSLHGRGLVGRGEEIAWGAQTQLSFRERGACLPLTGTETLGEFCQLLDTQELSPDPVPDAAWRDYRRWAFESAALDLALRQAGVGIEEQLGRKSEPLHFAVSLGLNDFEEIQKRLDLHGDMRFKLDATPDWSEDLCERLAQTGAVDVVDFKGAYSGTPVDVAPDLALYARVLDAMPKVIVEDPHNTPDVLAFLRERKARIAWDAPIHSMGGVDEMPLPSNALNIKPSRFGSLERLFETYEGCEARGLPAYGGGQFELGVGRRQIQVLASLFHGQSSNDVAPRGYHRLEDPEERPGSPLQLHIAPSGFDLVNC